MPPPHPCEWSSLKLLWMGKLCPPPVSGGGLDWVGRKARGVVAILLATFTLLGWVGGFSVQRTELLSLLPLLSVQPWSLHREQLYFLHGVPLCSTEICIVLCAATSSGLCRGRSCSQCIELSCSLHREQNGSQCRSQSCSLCSAQNCS